MVQVMLVDDDEAVRGLLRLLLERDDRLTVVAEAGDGVVALELLPGADPDVLVLDLAMPRKNGLQVLEELDQPDRPVVAILTGFDEEGLRDEALEAGAAAFLSKGGGFDGLADLLVGLARGAPGR